MAKSYTADGQEIKEALERLPNIKEAHLFTERKMEALRHVAGSSAHPDILICASGSFARREASSQSDLDFFAVCRTDAQIKAAKALLNELGPKLLQVVERPPAIDGAFDQVESLEGMLSNIGGEDDSNAKITRRILFLLEGDWLTNEPLHRDVFADLLLKYVRPTITEHQLALFLLNDIVRFYRTMCVDFDFKTVQGSKPWGIRNIKLIFARKLLYFSGLLAVAETAQRIESEKRRVLTELLGLPAVDRTIAVCGVQAVHALELYDYFLNQFSNPAVREELSQTTELERNKSDVFRNLKDAGHHFSWRLMSLFQQTYTPSHPIHRAIFF